jgi:hypothetical protein
MIGKFQSLSIFIISPFTTTQHAINCSSIICHSIYSILVEGEYRPTLKDCLIMSRSLSEALGSTLNKTQSATAFADPRLRPVTLVWCGARHMPVFLGALVPHFLFLARGSGTRGGASVRAGIICPATGRCASAFKQKPNNSHEQVQ